MWWLAFLALIAGCWGLWSFLGWRAGKNDQIRIDALRAAKVKDDQLQVPTPRTPSDLAALVRKSGGH